MNKLDGYSKDIVAQNIEKIQELFPEAVTETKDKKTGVISRQVNFDILEQVLGVYPEEPNERYNFTWNGKSQARRIAQTSSLATLRPCKDESKNWDSTKNLYIEGDNLEVLKLLQKSYHRKVKMIYIDPPYNTGKEFVYPDNFSQPIENYMEITGQTGDGGRLSTNSETSGRYHTDWLNMMYPRLLMARNLLRDDGVIFISIDDNEVSNLKKMCDEIFGEGNLIANFIWKKTVNPNSTFNNVGVIHEYILAYSRNPIQLNLLSLQDEDVQKYTGKDKYINERGPYKLVGMNKTGTISDTRPNLQYEITAPDGTIILPNPRWRWGLEKFQTGLLEDRVVFNQSKNKWNVYYKQYLYEDNSGNNIERGNLVQSIFEDDGRTTTGTLDLTNTIGRGIFDFPKPVVLLKKILKIATSPGDLVLDFFSGSGTTAHAVMQMNAERLASTSGDSVKLGGGGPGNLRYIMVQLPEPCKEDTEAFKAGYKNICEIGKERIRRAGEMIEASVGAQKSDEEENLFSNPHSPLPAALLDTGFKVFKLDSSNLRKWNPDCEDLPQELYDAVSNIVPRRTELDLAYEIMLKLGMDLTWDFEIRKVGGFNIYIVAAGALMMCLGDNITRKAGWEMAQLYKQLKPATWRVAFKDSGFLDDVEKTNIYELLVNSGLEEQMFTII